MVVTCQDMSAGWVVLWIIVLGLLVLCPLAAGVAVIQRRIRWTRATHAPYLALR